MGQPNRLPQTNILPFPPARPENERSRSESSQGADSGVVDWSADLAGQRPGTEDGYLIIPLRGGDNRAALDGVPPRARAPSQDLFETLKSPLVVPLSGLRLLAAAIILLAVLPTLVAAAILRLGLVDAASSPTVTAAPNQAAAPEVVIALPAISTRAMLRASPGESIPFPIVIDGTGPVEGLGTIAISRLPAGSAFSAGGPRGEATWELNAGEIDNLRLVLPEGERGERALLVQLLAPDGHVISDAATIVDISTTPEVPVRRVKTERIPADVWDQSGQTLEAMDAEAEIVTQGGTLRSDPVPLPSRRPRE